MIGLVPAHLACVGLVVCDMAARAFRIRLLASRLGARLSLGDALRVNLLGDAAAELTPFRIAGEPSRAAALLRSGVRADSALLALGAEFALSYAMVALLVVVASRTALPAWSASIGPALRSASAHVPLWAVGLVALAVGASFPLLSRVRARFRLRQSIGLGTSLRALTRIGVRPVAATLGLTGVNTVARVGILWALASTQPGAPAAATVLVGSFLLLFGQAFAPTPSGLGVVELGILGGAAGPLGTHALPLLVYWRAYTAIVPIVLAAFFVLPRFGATPIAAIFGLSRKSERAKDRSLPL